MTIYYVDTAGNDSNNGTSTSTPWKTLAASIGRLIAGDTLYVRGGTYAEIGLGPSNAGTVSSRITVIAYKNEKPIVDATGVPNPSNYPIFTIARRYFTLDGLEIRNNANGNGVEMWSSYGIVRKCIVHGNKLAGILFHANYGIIEENIVYDNSRVNAAMNLGGGWAFGLGIYNEDSGAIATNNIIRRNIVHSNYSEGIITVGSIGTLIENNILYDNWATNLYPSDCRDCLIQNNLSYASSSPVVPPKQTPAIILSFNDEKLGLPRSSGHIVKSNYLYNGEIQLFTWQGVANSVLNTLTFVNNTCINAFLTTRPTNIANTGNVFKNNIFYITNGRTHNVAYNTGLTFDYNCFQGSRPLTIQGAHDVVSDPNLNLIGNTSSGKLTKTYFFNKPSSVVNNAGTTYSASNSAYTVSYAFAPNIGACTLYNNVNLTSGIALNNNCYYIDAYFANNGDIFSADSQKTSTYGGPSGEKDSETITDSFTGFQYKSTWTYLNDGVVNTITKSEWTRQ